MNFHPFTALLLFPAMILFFEMGRGLRRRGMKSGTRDWIYTLVFCVTVTLTVYATLEIEYPRQGLLRPTELDQSFVALRNSMQ
jgi:hypothetical protein